MRGTHIKVAAVEHKSSSRIFLSFQALGFMICDLCLLWRLRHLRGRCWQWNNNLTACSNNNESHAINDRLNAKVTAKLAQKKAGISNKIQNLANWVSKCGQNCQPILEVNKRSVSEAHKFNMLRQAEESLRLQHNQKVCHTRLLLLLLFWGKMAKVFMIIQVNWNHWRSACGNAALYWAYGFKWKWKCFISWSTPDELSWGRQPQLV